MVFVLPLAWLLGAALASALPGAWPAVPAWLPLLLLGALVTLDRPLPRWALTAIAAGLSLLLGAANGQAMAQAGAGLRGILGSVAALFVSGAGDPPYAVSALPTMVVGSTAVLGVASFALSRGGAEPVVRRLVRRVG